jgi:hypothetical protein
MKKPKLTAKDYSLIFLALDILASDYAAFNNKGELDKDNLKMQKKIDDLEDKLREIQSHGRDR